MGELLDLSHHTAKLVIEFRHPNGANMRLEYIKRDTCWLLKYRDFDGQEQCKNVDDIARYFIETFPEYGFMGS